MFNIIKTVKKGDYVYAVVPDHPKSTKDGYVLLHRVIVENYIGRLLKSNEVVHHKDGNKHNNSIDNLEVMDSKAHNKMHSSTGRAYVVLTCSECGRHFTREKRQVKSGKPFCSRSCNGKYQRKRNWKNKSAGS